jgi:hypothetical protein
MTHSKEKLYNNTKIKKTITVGNGEVLAAKLQGDLITQEKK